jgi:transcriptional regulator with XRE-family HTH domain
MIKKEIRDRIGIIRERIGMNQVEFGERLSLERSTISLIERKQRNVTERTIRDICREFNVNEDWLRNGGDDDDMFVEFPEDEEFGRYVKDLLVGKDDVVIDLIRKILTEYCRLDEKSQEVVRELVDKLLKK